jgi:hypothetical protein
VLIYYDRLKLIFKNAETKRLTYLNRTDSELGDAIRMMVRRSAWGRWYAAQYLVNSGQPITFLQSLDIAAHVVMDDIIDGKLIVRGRLPRALNYEEIPRTHWRSSALTFVSDPFSLAKMIIVPTGGVEISRDGKIIRETHNIR